MNARVFFGIEWELRQSVPRSTDHISERDKPGQKKGVPGSPNWVMAQCWSLSMPIISV